MYNVRINCENENFPCSGKLHVLICSKRTDLAGRITAGPAGECGGRTMRIWGRTQEFYSRIYRYSIKRNSIWGWEGIWVGLAMVLRENGSVDKRCRGKPSRTSGHTMPEK